MPEWSDQGIDYILTTGSYQGRQAPTSQFSPLVGVDMRFQQEQAFEIERQDKFEYAILVINGTIKINGERYAKDEIAILSDCQQRRKKN